MQYDLNLAPNGGQRIEASGKFFKYRSGAGLIRVTTNKGEYIDLLPGQGAWGLVFDSLNIKNMTGTANTAQLVAGGFEFKDDNIFGVVTTIDNNDRDRSLSGVAFMGGIPSAGQGSGKFNATGIANPAGSGKNVIVDSILYVGDTTGSIVLYGGTFTPAVSASVPNKKVGGAVSVSKMFAELQTALPGTMITSQMYLQPVTIGAINSVKFHEPLIIPPGYTIELVYTSPSASHVAQYEFREEPI
jgi:hypothetical protein